MTPRMVTRDWYRQPQVSMAPRVKAVLHRMRMHALRLSESSRAVRSLAVANACQNRTAGATAAAGAIASVTAAAAVGILVCRRRTG